MKGRREGEWQGWAGAKEDRGWQGGKGGCSGRERGWQGGGKRRWGAEGAAGVARRGGG